MIRSTQRVIVIGRLPPGASIFLFDYNQTQYYINILMNSIQTQWQNIEDTLSKLSINTKTLCKDSTEAKIITMKQYKDAHDIIFQICSQKDQTSKPQETLYQKFTTLLTIYLMDIVKELQTSQGMTKVKKFRQIWNSYKSYLRLLKHLFTYLDRFYVPNNNIPSLEKKGLIIYCQIVLRNPQAKLAEQIYLEELQKVRNGDYTNMVILKEFIEIFVEIKAKDKVIDPALVTIESHYVEVAGEYYRKKFKELQNLPCGDYLKQVNLLYAKEEQIFNKCYQYQPTKQGLKKEFSKDLLQKYSENLLQKSTGLIAMLENRQVENLKLLSSIYKKLDCFSENIKHRFSQYFEKELLRFLSQKTKPLEQASNSREKTKTIKIQLIRELFKFNKDKFQLFDECFPNNPDLLNIYKFAVEKILNQYNSIYNISETLALYSDYVMRKKRLDWEEFQQELRQIFIVFNFLIDKDIYIKDYTQYLADRLIKGQSDDDMKDYEKSFISKLKQNCGVVYTSLVESILSDHTASKQESENFKKYLLERYHKSNFEVRVLNQIIWPHEEPFELNLPEQMKQLEAAFVQYFKHSQAFRFKNFKWAHLLSKLTFTLYLDKNVPEQKLEWCDITMNVLQGCILYFIYKRRPYKLHENQIITEFHTVEKQLLLQNLSALWNNHHPIILKTTEQTNTNYYEFNCNLVAKRIRIQYTYQKLNLAKKQAQIQNDRSLAIEMAIVKVMKTRKKLRFDVLVNEVSEILKNFSPTIKQIKQSIEKMLQKDYLQRDSKDISEYRYKQ